LIAVDVSSFFEPSDVFALLNLRHSHFFVIP